MFSIIMLEKMKCFLSQKLIEKKEIHGDFIKSWKMTCILSQRKKEGKEIHRDLL